VNHWTDDDHREFDLVVATALEAKNDRERTTAFVRLVKKYETAHEKKNRELKSRGADPECNWAAEVLYRAMQDGMWTRLKDEIKRRKKLRVQFGGHRRTVSGIGGAIRKTQTGVEFEQLELQLMSRDELLTKVGEHQRMQEAARTNEYVATKYIELIDQVPGASCAKDAASELGIDLDEYLNESTAS
jgi:hypothetical protein